MLPQVQKALPPVLLEALQQYKGQCQSLRQGRGQPVLCNDFLGHGVLNEPHALALARYYLAYNYRIFRARFIKAAALPRYLSKEQLKSLPRFPQYLWASNMAILLLQGEGKSQQIGPKGRNMLRKAAKNGYRVQAIDYDEHREQIFAINISKSERQGRAMDKAYLQYPEKRSGPLRQLGIEYHSFGCFGADGVLRAYLNFYRFGNVFRIDKVLGHGAHLTYGIMNLLFAQSAIFLAEQYPHSYLNYLTMNTIGDFKARLGFAPYNVLLALPNEPGVARLIRAARYSRTEDWRGDWVGRYLREWGAQ